jgi:hypothetical protein
VDVPTDSQPAVRTTVSIPAHHYAELERLARQNKVSVAWLVRDAVEKYLGDKAPLLSLINR